MPEQRALRQPDLLELLAGHARQLYEDGRLLPLLRRLMTASCSLTGSIGSSISIIDPEAGRYTKVAERGTACRLGESFPLEEGVTGRVMVGRRPIVLASYRDVATGHLPRQSRAGDGAVAAIPIWWRGEVIGANVVFAGGPRSFSAEEVDQLEVVTQVVAPGIVTAAGRDLALTDLLHRGGREARSGGGADPQTASASDLASGLASLVARAGLVHEGGRAPALQVRVLRDGAGARLQVKDLAESPDGWRDVVDDIDGAVRLGAPCEEPEVPCPTVRSPFSTREHQVALLLSRGMSDRAIAAALVISPKTAEKHVGAVLRKTGAASRTAAVVRALQRGWLEREPSELG